MSADSLRHRGPRRAAGAPVGPDRVRRATLDAAAELFAGHGIDAVSLRDIASAANVKLSLIHRYIGDREALILAVFDDLSEQLARDVGDRPVAQRGFDLDTVMGRWTRVAASLVLRGVSIHGVSAFNPVEALKQAAMTAYGLDEPSARLRAAQIMGSALGWRIFEDYLIAAANLDDVPRPVLRDELTSTHRRLGATPVPSPEDPPTRS